VIVQLYTPAVTELAAIEMVLVPAFIVIPAVTGAQANAL
jgi:hypothetical protein